jgi:hypothetical protein
LGSLDTNYIIFKVWNFFFQEKKNKFCEGKCWIFRSIQFVKKKKKKKEETLLDYLIIQQTCVEVAKGYSGYIIVDVLRTARGRGGGGVVKNSRVESVWPAWSQGAESAKESNQREPPNEAFQEKACLQQRPRTPP